MTGKLIGFDLDDTLIFTQHYYSLAQAELVKFIIESLGPKAPNAPTIVNLQVEKDLEGVKTKGFQIERFPESFAKTYIDIAGKMGVSEKRKAIGAREAYKIGQRVFDTRYWQPHLVPGAKSTLNFLEAQGDELFILTTGDPRAQNVKLEFYGLQRWFGNQMFVVPHHKKEKLAEIVGSRDKRNAWFVGNSARGDIKPALEIGIGAVYIPQETWAYDAHDLTELDTRRLNEIKEIGMLPKLYASELK
jgi:putative hydrolase of the HAD superfamily